MGRKSFKAGSRHHTKTNARNKYWKNLRKKENKRHKASVKNILENALILLVIFSLISAMCYFSM